MANKDWKGNSKSVFVTNGASNHSDGERAELDYYATSPEAVEALLTHESFSHDIWEPACGELHISRTLEAHGHNVRSSDIVARCHGVETKDFLMFNTDTFDGDIITNPPYAYAEDFVLQALQCVTEGHKVAMLVRLLFLEGQSRRKRIFDVCPPHTVYVFSKRANCAKNGDFGICKNGSAQAYSWMLWTKGNKSETTIKWI